MFDQQLGLKIVVFVVAAFALVAWQMYRRADRSLKDLGTVKIDQRRLREQEAEDARWKN